MMDKKIEQFPPENFHKTFPQFDIMDNCTVPVFSLLSEKSNLL